jgi:hypothetical protein
VRLPCTYLFSVHRTFWFPEIYGDPTVHITPLKKRKIGFDQYLTLTRNSTGISHK